MLRLKTKFKINSRVEVKCERHPTYNPEKHGKGAIRGNCTKCYFLFQIFDSWQRLQNALRDYEQIKQPYEKVIPRVQKPATGTSPELDKAFKTLLPQK